MTLEELSLPESGDSSAVTARRIATARKIQEERFAGISGCLVNADAEGELLEKIATPDADGASLLTKAADKFRLTARGYHRILRVARTIADLDGSTNVERSHIAEAISYRLIKGSG